jgi:hypothetical protein
LRHIIGHGGSSVGVLGAKEGEKLAPCPRGRGLRKIYLHPALGTAHIGTAAVAARVEVEKGLAVQVERAATSMIDAGPTSNVLQ